MRKTRSKSTERTRRPSCAERAPALTATRGAAGSDGEAFATLGATCVDDGTAPTGLHANEKPVRAGTADFGGLIGAFHDGPRSFACTTLCRAARSASHNGKRLALEPASGKPMIRPKTLVTVNGVPRAQTNTGQLPDPAWDCG